MQNLKLHSSVVFVAILLLAAVFLFGCSNESSNQQKSKKLLIETGIEVNGYVISIVEFDSCEYLVAGIGYSQIMTHKGNCKFCAHRYGRQSSVK